MKILIAGAELVKKNERYMDKKSWSFMKAFEKAGLEPEYFAYKLEGMFRFLETDKHLKKLWHFIMNKKLLGSVRHTRPDILLICKGGSIDADTLWEIRKKTGTIIINVMNDNPIFMGNFSAISPCHYYFVKDTYVLNSLRKIGFRNIHYLPQCTDPNVRKPLQLDAKDTEMFSSDLMIMGSMYPYRIKLVEELIDFKPAIWGKGWAKVKNAEILKLYKGRSVWGMDKTKAICGAAISLNHHHPLNDIKGTQSRTFDIAACRGFQLSEYKEDIEDLFRIGEEIICYRTIDELKKLLQYYLLHLDERKEISLAGHKRVLKDHTYDNRVQQILGMLNA
jgi:spore maturation protein CgeB